MKKWLIPFVGLTVAAAATAAVGITMVWGNGPSDQPPITSTDGRGPKECNWIHNVEACGDKVTDKVRTDLAARLGVDAGSITLVTRERVEWPDASLGLPQPGMMYAQVVVPGYQIVLRAGGQTYEYHTDLTGQQASLAQ